MTQPGAVSQKVCILERISCFVPTYRPNQSIPKWHYKVFSTHRRHSWAVKSPLVIFGSNCQIIHGFSLGAETHYGWYWWMEWITRPFPPGLWSDGFKPPEARLTQTLDELTSGAQVVPGRPRSSRMGKPWSQELCPDGVVPLGKNDGCPSDMCWFLLIPQTGYI